MVTRKKGKPILTRLVRLNAGAINCGMTRERVIRFVTTSAWLVAKALAPRYAIVATLITGSVVAWAGGDVVTNRLTL